jgi:hypothetical protein
MATGDAEALVKAIAQLTDRAQDPQEDWEKRIKWLYDILTILDSKTAHLLRLNAILLAASTFLVKMIFDLEPPITAAWRIALLVVMMVPLLGILFALPVFRVKWRFLPWHISGREIGESDSVETECQALAGACHDRTAQHARVYRVTVLSLLMFIATVIVAMLGVCGAIT